VSDCYTIWVEINESQWAESNVAQWGDCFQSILNQIWTDDTYVYAAIDFGLDIIDIITESKVAYIEYPGGFNSVWSSSEKLYLATDFDGVKYVNITCISGCSTSGTPYDLSDCVYDFKSEPNLTSNNVRYLHGNGSYLACCTTCGVDIFKFEPQGYRSYTTVTGAYKCFTTSTGKFYYTVLSGTVWSLNRVNSSLVDWSVPDEVFYANGNRLPQATINDIFVTEETAFNGVDNTLFVATSSGAYVLDESTITASCYYITI